MPSPDPTPRLCRTPRVRASLRTPERESAFLETLEATCSVKLACRAAGIGRTTAYYWRDNHSAFAARWAAARRHGADVLEDEAIRRAVHGYEEPVYYQGKRVGTITRYSDTLLMFLLRGAKPNTYKDRIAAEVTGANGGPIAIEDIPGRVIQILEHARARAEAEQAAGEPN